jgi:hypothetical protein
MIATGWSLHKMSLRPLAGNIEPFQWTYVFSKGHVTLADCCLGLSRLAERARSVHPRMPYSGGTCETFPILLNIVIMLDWISCCPPILVRIRETSFATSRCGCEVRSRILGQLDLGLKNRLAFQQMTIFYHFNRWIEICWPSLEAS